MAQSPVREPRLEVWLYLSRVSYAIGRSLMSSLQFWEHQPRLKYSVVMPRTVKSDHRFHNRSHAFFEYGLVIEVRCTWRMGRRKLPRFAVTSTPRISAVASRKRPELPSSSTA